MEENEWNEVLELLSGFDLPETGLVEHRESIRVAWTLGGGQGRGRLVGCIALEPYGDLGLLRSLAVAPEFHGHGLGRRLVDEVLGMARSVGIRRVYLLTESAEAFFLRLDFTVVARDLVPDAIRQSVEFAEVCPESAVVMVRAAG